METESNFSKTHMILLVNSDILDSMDKPLQDVKDAPNIKLTTRLHGIYENYISPNMFPIVVIVIISIYLYIRYIIKKERQKRGDKRDIDSVDEMRKRLIKMKKEKAYRESMMIKDNENMTIGNRRGHVTTLDDNSDEFTLHEEDFLTDTRSESESEFEFESENAQRSHNITTQDFGSRIGMESGAHMDKISQRTFALVEPASGDERDFSAFNS